MCTVIVSTDFNVWQAYRYMTCQSSIRMQSWLQTILSICPCARKHCFSHSGCIGVVSDSTGVARHRRQICNIECIAESFLRCTISRVAKLSFELTHLSLLPALPIARWLYMRSSGKHQKKNGINVWVLRPTSNMPARQRHTTMLLIGLKWI